MFTIKQVGRDGHEHLWEARSGISYAPTRALHGSIVPQGVVFTGTDGVVSSIDAGRVYVMNEQGATIARYVFDEDGGNTDTSVIR